MSKNTFELNIGGVDYTQYIVYPVEFVDKNLEEVFNTFSITLSRMSESEPFYPNQEAIITWKVDNIIKDTFYTYLLADAVSKMGNTQKYKHSLNLIEFTYFLDQILLPDITITRIEGVYEPKLSDVVRRILSIGLNEIGHAPFSISATTNAKLSLVSPEWTFTRMTVAEALKMVFGYAKITPTMNTFNELGHREVLLDEEMGSKTASFNSISTAYDPERYKTRITSSVDNFVVEDENIAPISEPGTGWITPRSADGYKISSDNLIIPTTRPIYRLEEFQIESWLTIGAKKTGASSVTYTSVPLDIIPYEWFIPIPVFEEGVWNALDNNSNYGQKGCSLYYKQGKTNILNLSYRTPERWSWNPEEQAIQNILNYIKDAGFDISILIKPEYAVQARNAAIARWTTENGQPPTDAQAPIYGISTKFMNNEVASKITQVSPVDLRVRLKYIPYIETNISSYRERKTNNLEKLTSQYYNQQANVISSEVLAELHDKIARSNSGKGKDLSFVTRNYENMINTGKRIGDYIITSGLHTINYSGIVSNYSIDEYYAKVNSYVAVLEKWRQFSIPNEAVVKRQITLAKFAKFSTIRKSNSSQLNAALYLNNESAKISLFRMNLSGTSDIVSYVSAFPFNNALVWETSIEGNASAGSRSVSAGSGVRRDEPIRYTDINGRLNGAPKLIFINEFSSDMVLSESHNLPIAPFMLTGGALFEQNIGIDKDAREQLSFSLQLHHVDETGRVYINKGFCAVNGLVGGQGLNNGLSMVLMDFKPHNTEKVLPSQIIQVTGAAFGMYLGSVNLARINNQTDQTARSYGLCKPNGDGTYKILYWVDEEVLPGMVTPLMYLNFDSNY